MNNSIQEELRLLYQRDLNLLIQNVQDTPEEMLWTSPKGVSNSVGVLVQHLVGNINHYIGKGIGQTGYQRNREREFTNTGISKAKLIDSIEDLKVTLNTIFDKLNDEQLENDFALESPFKSANRGIAVHIYGHLNYHLGQINYLRRLLET